MIIEKYQYCPVAESSVVFEGRVYQNYALQSPFQHKQVCVRKAPGATYLEVRTLQGVPICELRDEGEYVGPGAQTLLTDERAAILASAEAFRLAIMALPVGKDIRNRLNAALEAHSELIGDVK